LFFMLSFMLFKISSAFELGRDLPIFYVLSCRVLFSKYGRSI
jgi:hypothetical protein